MNGTESYAQPSLVERLNESLGILMHDNGTINSYNNKIYTYVLMDWRVDKWKPIMTIVEEKEGLVVKRLTGNALAFVTVENIDFISCDADNDCTGNFLRKITFDQFDIVQTYILCLIRMI